MPPSSDTVFLGGLDCFGAVVAAVPTDGWDAPSPCAGWSALDVLGHLGSAVDYGVSILEGRAHEWPTFDRPAELVVAPPTEYWDGIADAARAAVVGVDLGETRETMMGTRTIGEGLAFPAIDCYVHAWDIGHATGVAVVIPDDVITYAHHYLDPMPAERMRADGGPFGPVIALSDGADATDSFIAWTGRSPA